MNPVKPQWQELGAVLVCEKCYLTRIPEETPELAERYGDFNLQRWLKEQCKEAGFGKRLRVIRTGCQDVCAIGRVTVTMVTTGERCTLKTLEIDPLEDREAILQRILDEFGQSAKD
jgi:predicted metal-binding protein